MSMIQRTPLQAEASRKNGARSKGPRTPAGKARSAANSIRTGAYTNGAVLTDEDRQAVSDAVRSWMTDFGIRSFAGAQLVRHAVDATLRLDRIERLRDRLLAARLDKLVAESDAQADLTRAQEVLQAVNSLVGLTEGIAEPVPRGHVGALLAPFHRLAEAVADLGLDRAVAGPMVAAVKVIDTDDVSDILPIAFADLAAAGRGVVVAIQGLLPGLAQRVETERGRQASLLPVADDKMLATLDRLKLRISKELGGYVSTLRTLRELEAKSAEFKSEGPPTPILLDFKAVGGASPR